MNIKRPKTPNRESQPSSRIVKLRNRKAKPSSSAHHGTAAHRAFHYLYDDLLN
jgi:hypothetical protein